MTKELKRMDVGQTLVIAMANLRPQETGLPMVIWVQPKTGREKHGPRIKVQTQHGDRVDVGNWVSVTITDTPKVIGSGLAAEDKKLVAKFIRLNFSSLIQLWKDAISPTEFAQSVKKVVRK